MVTNYTYDGFENLMKVTQWGGASSNASTNVVRSFNYSGLSQLLCASNPENSLPTVACPAAATTLPTAGTVSFVYDADGNRVSRTDARGVTTAYVYDGLNRITDKTY